MKKIGIFIIIICIYVFNIQGVFASDFFSTANKTEVFENEFFDVNVYINSDGTAINSAEGSLSFPADILSVVSVTNISSIFSIWVEQPTYSNANGTVSFNGGLPNPGFSGAKGNVIKVTFKTKKTGTANISFGAGSIYSNDGSGTDVLKRKSGVSVFVKSATVTPVVKEDIKKEEKDTVLLKPVINEFEIVQKVDNQNTQLPPTPIVTSQDLIDGQEWFKIKNINLDWDVPSGVTAVQFSFGGKEDSMPTSVYSPAVNFTKIVNVANGVSYFHIRFKNKSGWGEVLHKKIMVDVVSPSDINIKSNLNDKKLVSLTVNSEDIHSGVDKYEVYVDTKKIAESKGESGKETVINLPLLKTGQNKLNVIVYDYAKNTNNKLLDVNSSEPEPAEIKISKTEVKLNEENNLSVKTYPDTELKLFIKDENGNIETLTVKTENTGIVNIPLIGFKTSGIKTFWVSFDNECSDICVLSEKVTVNVLERKLIYIPKALLGILQNESSGFIPWVIAFIFLVLYLLTFRKNKNRDIIQELNKAEIDVYKIFKVLKADAKKYKAMLKRNKIDVLEKDQAIIEVLEKDLDEAETYFAKRIEKIEMEL